MLIYEFLKFDCSALITSMEPDVTIRIIPETTSKTASSRSSARDGKSSQVAPVRLDDVQVAHVAVFATGANARPRMDEGPAGGPPDDIEDIDLFGGGLGDIPEDKDDGKSYFMTHTVKSV